MVIAALKGGTRLGVSSAPTAVGMMCSADSGRICASGYVYPLALPCRRVAHYHDEGVQQQERHSIEEQTRDNVPDR